jgi:hypothetical protein
MFTKNVKGAEAHDTQIGFRKLWDDRYRRSRIVSISCLGGPIGFGPFRRCLKKVSSVKLSLFLLIALPIVGGAILGLFIDHLIWGPL